MESKPHVLTPLAVSKVNRFTDADNVANTEKSRKLLTIASVPQLA